MDPNRFTILIAEDDTFCRKGLELVLREKYDLRITIYQAKNGKLALEYFKKYKIDILLTDINMEPLNGLELARIVREKYPHIKIIAITGFITLEYLTPLSKLEVDAVLFKVNGNLADLESAMTAVLAGNKFTSPDILSYFAKANNLSLPKNTILIDDRDLKIIQFLAKGYQIQQLPDEIPISLRSIQRILENLRIRFNVKTNTELINKAKEMGVM